MTAFDPLYRLLAGIGLTDPIHPPMTHLPVGLVVAALLFAVVAWLFKRPALTPSARHCLVLAWLFFFPTVALGFMDWQHYYGGAWLLPIVIKMWLTGCLFVLLSLGLVLQFKGWGESKAILLVYFLALAAVLGLGFFGGKLIYGGQAQTVPDDLRAGKALFDSHCAGCHENGGNSVMPEFILRCSDELQNFPTFLARIRKPKLTDGSKGPMPAFPESVISEPQAQELYRYLSQTFGPPGRKD